jgi:hypothetical protein
MVLSGVGPRFFEYARSGQMSTVNLACKAYFVMPLQ